jgi:predicted ester cyclase
MSAEENKKVIRRVWEEAMNKGNLAVADEVMAANYVFHGPGGVDAKGPEGFKQYITIYRTAFPDLHCTIDDMVAEGDKVVSRFTLRGTHKGDLMGIAPTGKKAEIMGIAMNRFAGGKEVEAWGSYDMLKMYQQLGISPPGG